MNNNGRPKLRRRARPARPVLQGRGRRDKGARSSGDVNAARGLLRALPDLVLTLDRHGTILSVNRYGADVSRALCTGGSLFGCVPPEDHEATRASLAQVFTTGHPARFECRGFGPSGLATWHECRLAPLLQRRRVVSAVLIASDISGKKRAELALANAYQELDARVRERTRALSQVNERLRRENEERRQAEQTLRTIFASEPECVKLLAPDGTVQTMNPAGLAMLQADRPAQVVGQIAYGFVTPEHRDAFRELHEAAFGGGSGRLEFEAVGLKGRSLWLETHVVPLRDTAGKVVSALGITRDITERRRAEAERAAIEERYRTLVENMPAVTYLANPDATGSTIFMSRQVRDMTGFTPEEWCADPELWPNQIHPEHRERVLAEWVDSTGAGRPFRSKYRLLGKDGRLVWWRDEAHLVHDDAGRTLYHGVVLDVTAEEAEVEGRTRAEARLSRNLNRLQRLFEITAAVNRGADAGAVHELALDALIHGLGVQRASILMLDTAGAMRLVASRGLTQAYRRDVEGHSPWTQADNDPEPILITDVATATQLGPLRETILREGIGALAFIPIFKERLLGKFMLYYDAPQAPDAEDIQFAFTLARQIGLATERGRAERALHESHDSMRRLAEHLQLAREEERARIAREVHDELGQTLTALKLDLAWLKGRLVRRPELAGRVAETSGLADTAIRSVRRISTALRPVVLDDLGLAPAVEWLAHDVEARTGIRCLLGPPFEDLDAGGEVSTHIFRLFQEALTNVVRHSGATEVRITLGRSEGSLRGEIRDNGRGISLQQRADPQALGLLSMRERVRLLGGEIAIGAGPEGGTAVQFRCPKHTAKLRHAGSR